MHSDYTFWFYFIAGHEYRRKKGLEGPTQKALREARQQKILDAESSSCDPGKNTEKRGKRYPKVCSILSSFSISHPKYALNFS